MKHQKFIFKLVLLFFVIFNVKSAISQEEGLLNKTKSQIKLTETKQLYLQGNIKTALLNYKEIIALNSSSAKAHFGISRCYYKLHDYKKAKYHAEIAEKNDPKVDEDLYYLMGEIYFRLEELKKSKIIVVEGTLYPLLNRLKKSEFVSYSWKESKQGPPRKYYSLTKEGVKHLKNLILSWNEIDASVKKIIKSNK